MIPVSELTRLLRSITADVTSDSLRRSHSDGLTIYLDLDAQDYATLARIVAGEAWGGQEILPGEWEVSLSG